MAVRLSKPWQPLTAENVGKLTSHLGVYQLALDDDTIVYIGVAGGRSTFGLKGEVSAHLDDPAGGGTHFRTEINMSYRSRHLELLQVHVHDHGTVPVGNTDIDPATLGRMRPD
ncbi:MAG: hypothetical protein HOI95_24865 [Chromatiales bacterium]|jgi:hypothetical protein|nr:hypothetical protein [Chromatiales bacterium]